MKNPGVELEEYIARRLGAIESYARRTIASGAILNDEDIQSTRYVIQCKDTSQRKNFIIQWEDWRKLQSAALKARTPNGDYKTGLFCSRNSEGTIVVSLDIEDFLEIIECNKGGDDVEV